ncbi:MFS transporter [Penicillium riverlandense]|uniref:MFS transporter n=1 Tax=Penicillium riverlandense TaxID=1903569 RepID=UPI002546FB09|nr:MFS transporter [Penicillium riverlandense]KAJ5820085.1 MFS transporter [Penicillium riverlandense]
MVPNPAASGGRTHLVHSHAHEGDIPGTVDLSAAEGDDTAYGQALYPVPAEDPNDPLQWPMWKKNIILITVSVYSFLGNSSLVGPSVYIGIYSEEFGISASKASGLISYPNLAFGIGSLILVPMYLKLGRRPVTLLSLATFLAGLIGASRSTTYTGLMVARVFHGFGSGVCESLPVQFVNDIFFIHERGKRIGYYTGYMLAGGYSWRLFFYVEAAFAAALLIMAFLFVEESAYNRPPSPTSPHPSSNSLTADNDAEKIGDVVQVENASGTVPPRKTFLATLKPWSSIDPDAKFFVTMLRSFSYFFIPAVFWVIASYGLYIGLGALAFNYTFPLKITEPPYNWSQTNSGLIAVGSFVGYFLALPFTSSSDRLAAILTKRNNGIREAEMRLPVLFPAILLAPAGLVVYGFTAQRNLHWVGYFAGVALDQFGSYFYFTFTLAYAVDSYNANTPEMLIAMNLGKQAISFGMGSFLLDWILTRGYAVVISGIFGGVLLANNLMVVVFVLWGKPIRRWTAQSWLGKMHARTATRDMTH